MPYYLHIIRITRQISVLIILVEWHQRKNAHFDRFTNTRTSFQILLTHISFLFAQIFRFFLAFNFSFDLASKDEQIILYDFFDGNNALVLAPLNVFSDLI